MKRSEESKISDLDVIEREGFNLPPDPYKLLGSEVKKSLTPLDRVILQFFATGITPAQVAYQVKSSTAHVFTVIKSPVGQDYLRQIIGMSQDELKMLQPKAVDVLREALKDGSLAVQFAASKEVLKQTTVESEIKPVSAEDLVAEIDRQSAEQIEYENPDD